MKLVIIIPALNEERTIGHVIDNIPRTLTKIEQTETIVVNDGSKDATASIAASKGAHVVHHQKPMGVGAAFHTGIRTALKRGADIIVNIDADGQFDPQDIPKLLAPIHEGRAEFVTATRFGKAEFMPDMPEIKKWGNKWMTRIINFLTRKNFTDVSCGFRAYTRHAALKLTLFGHFTYTQETFIDLAFKDISMTEVPLKVEGERKHGNSRVASNLWRYGIKSATIIFRAARDYKPFYMIGVPGIVFCVLGIAVGGFVVVHYFKTGQTFPYRNLVPASGILLIIGFLLLFISMLADMLHRNRILIEELLYFTRSKEYAKKNEQ